MSEGSKWSIIVEEATLWLQQRGLWWVASVSVHAVILAGVVLLMDTTVRSHTDESRTFEAEIEKLPPDPEIEHFELGEAPLEPTELTTDTLLAATPTVSEQVNTNENDAFVEDGGGMSGIGAALAGGEGLTITGQGSGPMRVGGGGGAGEGTSLGSGGKHEGFGQRGAGVRKAMLGNGGTKDSERAVAAALNWLARHQLREGNWSLNNYQQACKDETCSGKGTVESNSAATAMALLPFLAAGQTHRSAGPYKKNIGAGLHWMVENIKNDGDLSAGSASKMYTHGLATICLCEAYGLTGDKEVGGAAQAGINFIVQTQNPAEGGWRYGGVPTEGGDTSVAGWQIMALKSGIMAGLDVPTPALKGAEKFLKLCARGEGGQFSYVPDPATGASPSMTAVGLLCSQYLGMERDNPSMVEGIGVLMQHLPNPQGRNVYFWYYATQVMHNVPGPEWDAWNRKMRKLLITTQVKKGCAEGSWDPAEPVKDPFGEAGGRLMMTSLSCLTLEVYYRYLPLYKLDETEKAAK